MTWFRADDTLTDHPKTIALLDDPRGGLGAIGLWVLSATWCGRHLTDGALTSAVVRQLGGTEEQAAALVACGLWEVAGGGRYRFHDWLDWNPSKDEVLLARDERHEARVRAGRAGGLRSGERRRSKSEANAKQNEAPSRPVPSRPGVPSEHSETRAPARAGGRYTTPADEAPGSERRRVGAEIPTPLGAVVRSIVKP